MSLLSELIRDRWLVERGRVESSYLPVLVGLFKASFEGREFPAFQDKAAMDFSLYNTGNGFNEHHFITPDNNGERSNFIAGATAVANAIPEAPAGSIAVIPIKGEFLRYGTLCAWGADEIVPVMNMAAEAENISAVVLDFDSGGGAERAVPPFVQAIQYIQKKKKPVVAHGDMVASAAYYTASYTDYILANNKISSAFGSVGALVTWVDYREYFKNEGINIEDIYAPQSTLKNNSYRQLLEGNPEPLKAELKKAVDVFINNVKRARKGKFSDNEDIWAGALFEHNDIVKNGLADGYGDLFKAIEIAAALAEGNQINN